MSLRLLYNYKKSTTKYLLLEKVHIVSLKKSQYDILRRRIVKFANLKTERGDTYASSISRSIHLGVH